MIRDDQHSHVMLLATEHVEVHSLDSINDEMWILTRSQTHRPWRCQQTWAFYIPYVGFKRSCVCLGLLRQRSEGEVNVGDRRWTTRARGETKLWKTKGKRRLQRRQKRVRWFYGVNTIIIESGNEGKIAFFGWAHLAMLPMWTIQSGDTKCVDHHRQQKVLSSLWPQSI